MYALKAKIVLVDSLVLDHVTYNDPCWQNTNNSDLFEQM